MPNDPNEMPAAALRQAPSDFWQVTFGDRLLFLKSCDRLKESEAMAEADYWRRLLGPSVTLDRISTGADLVTTQMAVAIQSLSRDGSGVTRDHLRGMGFSGFHLERHFPDALAMVTAAFAEAPPAILTPAEIAAVLESADNVLPFRPRTTRTH